MEGLAEQGVGHVGSVELGGVDVVHPGLHGPADHLERGGVVLRGPQYTGSGKLHGAEAHAVDGTGTEQKRFVGHHPGIPGAPGGRAVVDPRVTDSRFR